MRDDRTKLDVSVQVALITGASRGIGAEAAMRMPAAGARVAVNDFRSERDARREPLRRRRLRAMA